MYFLQKLFLKTFLLKIPLKLHRVTEKFISNTKNNSFQLDRILN